MKERNHEIDVLKGIGILLMIASHVHLGDRFHILIHSFHMPLFFIVSGYLWKQQTVKETICKRLKSLMVPYCFFSLLYFLMNFIWKPSDNYDPVATMVSIVFVPTDMNRMLWFTPLWFLPCMFFASIIYSVLSQRNLLTKAICVTAFAIIVLLLSVLSESMLPFCLEPVATGLMFMLVGEVVRNFQIEEKLLSNKYLLLLFLPTWIVLSFINGGVDMRSGELHIIPLFFVNVLLGTLVLWCASRLICNSSLNAFRFCQVVFRSVGKSSIIYLCIHLLPLMLLKRYLLFFAEGSLAEKAFFKLALLLGTILTSFCVASMAKKFKTIRFLFGKS